MFVKWRIRYSRMGGGKENPPAVTKIVVESRVRLFVRVTKFTSFVDKFHHRFEYKVYIYFSDWYRSIRFDIRTEPNFQTLTILCTYIHVRSKNYIERCMSRTKRWAKRYEKLLLTRREQLLGTRNNWSSWDGGIGKIYSNAMKEQRRDETREEKEGGGKRWKKRLKMVVEKLDQFYPINCVSGGPRSAGFLDQRKLHSPIKRDGRRTNRREKKRIKGRETLLRFHDRIWQRFIISNDVETVSSKLWSKLWTFRLYALCFVFDYRVRLANKWKQMEKSSIDFSASTTNRFPVLAPRHMLKEFLNGQITLERISNDTFERARSNWKPAVRKFLSWRDGDLAAGHLRHKLRFNSV